MMEAKDTVMSDEQLEQNIRKDYENFQVKTETDRVSDILMWTRETQAEISFKAGYEEGRTVCPTNEMQGTIYLEGKQAGIKEVVEFIQERLQRYKVAPKLLGFTMLSEDWESALKEWGCESPSGVEE